MAQINFQIPDEKKKKFDIELAKNGENITKILNKAIDDYLPEELE